jgi:hypothetical protein
MFAARLCRQSYMYIEIFARLRLPCFSTSHHHFIFQKPFQVWRMLWSSLFSLVY